jgi:nucleotidyltransferase/DNA polymerase involved in DNA repair
MIDLDKHWKSRNKMTEQKYIALIDCDSFFVSCERKINPRLCGKPVCVVSGDRGCVVARSIEAKEMGIPMGHPLFMAKKEFPDAIYINSNLYLYSQISEQVMNLLRRFSPMVEVYSIDEAFVDLTGLAKLYKKNYYNLALSIREIVAQEIGIPVSVGVSRTKTLAKLASDKSKTTVNHVYIAGRCGITRLLKSSEIGEVWGIGRNLEPKLRGHGIYTAYDYAEKNDTWLKSRFGKLGLELKYELLGNQIHKISDVIKPPKSIMDTKSFPEFSTDINYLKNELMIHIHSACRKLRKANCKCKTIGVIIKTKDFKTFCEKENLEHATNFEFEISELAIPILEKMFNRSEIYRSVGILLENFKPCDNEQRSFFDNSERREKNEKLAKSLDKLEAKFGRNIIKTGFVGKVDYKQDFISKN